jgi:hypothetical protein
MIGYVICCKLSARLDNVWRFKKSTDPSVYASKQSCSANMRSRLYILRLIHTGFIVAQSFLAHAHFLIHAYFTKLLITNGQRHNHALIHKP